ncbi:MAG: hypothetical protein PEPC_01728 [Peptostreptococcus russellii]
MNQIHEKTNLDAIAVIDTVMLAIIDKTISKGFLERIFSGKFNQELYHHLISKWDSQDQDFFRYYLDAGDSQKRIILEALGIKVERDIYPDYESRILAQFSGISRDKIFPFEIHELNKFCLFGYNNPLTVLNEISEAAWEVVTTNGIDPYGNTMNWATWWNNADIVEKGRLLGYIEESLKVEL